MTGLLSVFQKRKEEAAESSAGRWREYVEILERADKPRKGDAERLAELADLLTIDEKTVALHVEVIELRKKFQAGADAGEAARLRMDELDKLIREQLTIAGTARVKADELSGERDGENSGFQAGLEYANRLKVIEREWPQISGKPEQAPRPEAQARGWLADLKRKHDLPAATHQPAPRHGVGDL